MWTIHQKRRKKVKEIGDSRYIYQNELDKACFQHGMAYGDSKDLHGRTISDKALSDKVFNIDKNPKYDGYQRGRASMIYTFFDKKAPGGAIKNKIMSNQELAKALHKSII